jgi:predicted hexulose-6-phosphate isomerase
MTSVPSYRFGIYEKMLKSKPFPEMFEDAVLAGYETFEISLDETDTRLERLNWTPNQFFQIQNAAKKSGIQLFSACLSGHRRFPLGSADKVIEKRGKDLLRAGINFCSNLGIRVLQLSGFDVFYEPHTEETSKRYLDNLASGVMVAEQYGVMLAIEPVEGHITSIHDAVSIVNQIHSPWLQVYPDAANLVAMDFNPVSELIYGEGHMVALHLRDAHLGTSYNIPWGTGTLDFIGVFQQLQKLNFNGPIIVELWHEEDPDYLESARASREYLITKIQEAHVESEGFTHV